MTLGDVIAQFRKEHGLSMDKFAAMSGISKAYISMLEQNRTARGNEPSPSIETYRAAAKAMGIEFDTLLRTVEGRVALGEPVDDKLERDIDDDDLRFALFGGDAGIITNEMLDEVKRFAKFIAAKEKDKQNEGENS